MGMAKRQSGAARQANGRQAPGSPASSGQEGTGDPLRAFEILLSDTWAGVHDLWEEYLCIEQNADGTVTLSSRAHEGLAETFEYTDEDGEIHLPSHIEGKAVGVEGQYI